jgi:hypothetical protein
MHSVIGHSLLFGEEKREEWDVFKGWMNEEKVQAVDIMRKAILVTDMAHHFTTRDKLNYLIGQVHTLADIGHDDRTDINVGGVDKPQSISSILARTIYTTDKSHAGDRSRDQSHAELELISNQLAGLISFFLLHAADISNSAKSKDLATYWSSRVLSE